MGGAPGWVWGAISCLLPCLGYAILPRKVARERERIGVATPWRLDSNGQAKDMDKEQKREIIDKYHAHETDTGSSEVQVAIFTARISQLTDHLRRNKHDFHTRRALTSLVGQRRRHLAYINRQDVDRYQKLILSLGLRR